MWPDGLFPKLVVLFAAACMTTAAAFLVVGTILPAKTPPNIPVGMVAPHHDLVKAQRKQLFETVRAHGVWPTTVVLVSPNHFEVGHANVQVTKRTWNTSLGDLPADTSVVDALVASGAATDEDAGFSGEHGIKLLLPDIQNTWPGAKVVPIMLKFNTTAEQVAAVLQTLQTNCSQCFVVASVDFSHYQPELLADLHDTVNRRVLDDLDQANVYEKAEVDSPSSLALLMGWAEQNGAEHFVEWKHTNSGTLLKNSQIETTTHEFGWYEKGGRTVADPSVTFSLARVGAVGAATFSKFGDRVLWGTDASMLETTAANSAAALVRATKAGDVHVAEGGAVQTASYTGEGLSLGVVWALPTATTDAVATALANLTSSSYRMVIADDATSEQEDAWFKAGATLVVLKTGDLTIEKKVNGIVVHGQGVMTDGPSAVIAGKFTATGLDIFSLPTNLIGDTVQITSANPLLHFPLK